MRFPLAGSSLPPGLRARRALFPTCGVVRIAGYSVVWECISTSEFLQRAPKGALRPFSAAALLHYVSWCALEYSVVGRISCYVPYDSARTNVCQWLFAEIFSLTAAVSNRIDSIRNLFIIFALDFPALENPISEKNELLYSAILPFVPCLILIFKPIRIILVEIFRVVVFVAQTVRAVVRAAGLVLRWGAWFVLRLMINCSF